MSMNYNVLNVLEVLVELEQYNKLSKIYLEKIK